MYLQLAERRKGKVNVSSYKRKSSVASHSRRYPLNDNGDLDNPYIFVPNFESGGGIYVREDKFDGLPDAQWAMFMKNLAPFQPEIQNRTLSEPMFLASRADRKADRARRREARTQKKEARTEEKKSRTQRRDDRVAGRQERAERRAEARDERIATRAEKKAGGGGFDWERAKEAGGAILNKFTGGSQGGGDYAPEEGGSSGAGMSPTIKYILIGGAVIAVIGGVLYAMNNKSKPAPSLIPA